MTVSVTHPFVSAKGDGADSTQVQPSNWNAAHTITCAANKVLGNSTGSPGAVGEIAAGTIGVSILGCNTLADLIAAGVPIFSTGDVKLTMKTAADTGWLMCADQTIGNVSSGATFADATAQSLYTLIWNNVSNTYAPVAGGRGGSAAADWAAQKSIQLTLMLGRALAIGGSGSGLSARSLGQNLGEENHTLSTGEMPSHNHGISDPGHIHGTVAGGKFIQAAGTGALALNGASFGQSDMASATTGITINNAGSGSSHNNMQPTSFLNAMIKL